MKWLFSLDILELFRFNQGPVNVQVQEIPLWSHRSNYPWQEEKFPASQVTITIRYPGLLRTPHNHIWIVKTRTKDPWTRVFNEGQKDFIWHKHTLLAAIKMRASSTGFQDFKILFITQISISCTMLANEQWSHHFQKHASSRIRSPPLLTSPLYSGMYGLRISFISFAKHSLSFSVDFLRIMPFSPGLKQPTIIIIYEDWRNT